MKNKITTACFFMLLLFTQSVFAQQKEWTGQVLDESLVEPLIGVSVIVKGTSIGTITDVNGNFSIRSRIGQTLVFSYIGYNSIELPLKPETSLTKVFLKENTELLDEVVVVGYGVQTKASSVGSISTTKGSDLLKVGSVTSVSEALQGQMPGVVAISSTSKPGADAADLFIRGKSTWGNASPLILVDGIERDFNDVSMHEIEALSVLKDASATAVYGVKGANGVILITTKRGSNKKTEVSLTANFGFKQPSVAPTWADYPTTMRMFNEAKVNDNGWGGLIPESTINAWDNAIATGNYGPYNDYFPQVDWWKETVKDFGTEQEYNINVTGGTDRMRYFTSVGYLYDGDIYKSYKNDQFDPSFNYKRYNWRSNFDFNLTKTTLLSFNVAGKMGYRNQPAYRPDVDDSWFFKFFNQNNNNQFPIKYSNGEWGAGSTGEGNIMSALTETGSRMYKSYQGFYDFKLDQDLNFITKGLSAKGSLSYTTSSSWESTLMSGMNYDASDLNSINSIIRYYRDYDYSNPIIKPDGTVSYNTTVNQRFQDETAVGDYPVGGSYDNFANYSRKLYYELALNYARTFGDHKVSALALWNRKNEEYTEKNADGTPKIFLEYPVLEEDWVTRATYGYKEKYLVEVNAAYTGSEKFAPGKRFGLFSSYSLGWRASEEKWVKAIAGDGLSNLKFRYSYGTVGNDKGAPRFNYIQSFDALTTQAQFGLYQSFNWKPIYQEGQLADPNATWEKSTKQNLGIELGLWNKLNITVDLFDEQRNQILMQRNTVPAWLSSGVVLPAVNLGSVKNHGIEVEANWNDKIGKVNYFVKFNFALSENRVVFRDDPQTFADYLKDAGKPIGYQTKYIATGNFQSIDDIYNSAQSQIPGGLQNTLIPGDLYYIDYNGDGQITTYDQAPMSYMNYPLTTAGLTIGGDYKGIGFNALFYTAMDVYKEQISSYLWDFPSGNIKAQPNTLDRWTPTAAWQAGPVRPSVHVNNSYNSQGSTYTYTNHQYLRLKNVEVNYSFPNEWIKRLNIERCQVYVNGNNLFTISSVDKRRDPETSGSNVYPIVKRYNVGLRLGF